MTDSFDMSPSPGDSASPSASTSAGGSSVTPPPLPRSTRIRRAEEVGIEPAYPAARVLSKDAVAVQQTLDEAEIIRRNAQGEAEEIIAAAKVEAEKIRASAPMVEESAQPRAQNSAMTESHEQLAALVKNVDSEITDLRGRFANDVQNVAFRFARAILDVEFEVNPQRVVDLVQSVLPKARRHQSITIQVHPDALPFVQKVESQLLAELECANEISFAADPTLPSHGLRIETEMGTYDAAIESQLDQLMRHLKSG